MEVAVYHGKQRVEDTTIEEILETFINKKRAQEIVAELQKDGICKRTIKGTNDFITYKLL